MADSLRSHVGKDVLFGIRPEDLLYDEAPAAQNNIKARVEVVEPLGAEIHLYVSTSRNQIIARVPPRHDFQVGEEVNLHPDVNKLPRVRYGERGGSRPSQSACALSARSRVSCVGDR